MKRILAALVLALALATPAAAGTVWQYSGYSAYGYHDNGLVDVYKYQPFVGWVYQYTLTY